jgi:hypothetical protein
MTKNPPQSPFKKGGKYEIATSRKALLAMTDVYGHPLEKGEVEFYTGFRPAPE